MQHKLNRAMKCTVHSSVFTERVTGMPLYRANTCFTSSAEACDVLSLLSLFCCSVVRLAHMYHSPLCTAIRRHMMLHASVRCRKHLLTLFLTLPGYPFCFLHCSLS